MKQKRADAKCKTEAKWRTQVDEELVKTKNWFLRGELESRSGKIGKCDQRMPTLKCITNEKINAW